MQAVLVCLQPFHHNSGLKCALHPKITKKFTEKPLFGRFKVIDVDKSKKPATSACYDKHHVYLSATVFTLYKPITAK